MSQDPSEQTLKPMSQPRHVSSKKKALYYIHMHQHVDFKAFTIRHLLILSCFSYIFPVLFSVVGSINKLTNVNYKYHILYQNRVTTFYKLKINFYRRFLLWI